MDWDLPLRSSSQRGSAICETSSLTILSLQKESALSSQGALQDPGRRGKSNGTGTVHLFRRIRVVMSAHYDGEIPQPLNVNLRHASMVSWMEQKGQ